jgi:uncharacterized protein (DUF1778 family)
MSTKVISSKVTPEEYDALLEACNMKGCTISQFVKDACLEKIGRKEEFSESKVVDHKESSKLVSDLENKIIKLRLELSNTNSTISKQNQQIKEFYDLVPETELGQRRLERHLHKLKLAKNCAAFHLV